jgi:hypothetical protein
MESLIPPALDKDAFNCPHCGAYSEQRWYSVTASGSHVLSGWRVAQCRRCQDYLFWKQNVMVYPDASVLPLANPDMPEDVRIDYDEARGIAARSARGAAALLRLCIQKLCKQLGQPGKDLNKDISALVKQGLNVKVQRSLDVVRVIGNEAVHPGTIDLRDNPKITVHLAVLVNIITDAMITQPNLVDSLYDGLPETKKDQINRRDATALPPAPLHTATQQKESVTL